MDNRRPTGFIDRIFTVKLCNEFRDTLRFEIFNAMLFKNMRIAKELNARSLDNGVEF